MISPIENRSCREFWAVNADWPRCDVLHVKGFERPHHADVWWVPDLGFTMTIGHDLFATEKEALERAVQDLTADLNASAISLGKLTERLKNL